jgi:uncharacterized protein (DUF58 family)
VSRSLRIVLVLLILSLLSWIFSGKVIFLRLVYLWVFLLVTSWLWARSALKGIQFRRFSLVDKAQVGQVFSEQFEIKNSGRIPVLWLEVKDGSELPGASGSRVLTLIGGHQTRSYFSRDRLLQRGVFSLGPTTLVGGDVFGLFRSSVVIPEHQSLLVYPYVSAVPEFPHPPGLLTGGDAIHQKTTHVTTNASGVREYTPGDSWNRIHWVSTARRERLMVKEFELDPRSEVWIFLDGELKSQAALPFSWSSMVNVPLLEFFSQVSIPPTTEEYTVSIAASLARYYLECGRAVGLVENGRVINTVAPDRGFRQLGKILQSLALFHAESQIPFTGMVSSHTRYISRGSTTIMVTPSVDPQLTGTVDQVSRFGLRPILILLDAFSFGGPTGSADLEESIRKIRIPVKRVTSADEIEDSLTLFSRDHSLITRNPAVLRTY